jgi:uncharacterized protein YecE (DUF72 family)
MIRVGTAGWTIPRRVAEAFPAEGAGLQRYTARFNCAEINSTFYRPHRPATYERWAASTPPDFRFAVKAPKAATHQARLRDCAEVMARFLAEVAALGDKLGPVLVQLPPSLAWDPAVAPSFFADLRARHTGAVVCEPRHPSWFTPEPEGMLTALQVARVAADPARVPEAARPGGWPGLAYWRLHGSPRLYYSAYEPPWLDALARDLAAAANDAWCIFDNTVSGAAAANALELSERLTPAP